MGVVHKLKEEILEYILYQKKDNPKLSCRALVNIVCQKFNVIVSKSSINTVLKNAQLSSPVGRRNNGHDSLGTALQRQEQQKELDVFHDPEKDAFALVGTTEKKTQDEEKKKEITYHDTREKYAFKKAHLNNSLQKGRLYDGMGCFFLKAAEWDLMNGVTFGNILEQQAKGPSFQDISQVGEILLFLTAFGLNGQEDLSQYKNQGLWVLNEINKPLDSSHFLEGMHAIDEMKHLVPQAVKEIQQSSSLTNDIKIVLEDGTKFFIDGQCHTILSDNPSLNILSSLWKVLDVISNNIIHNIFPIIINTLYNTLYDQEFFYHIAEAFEGRKGKKIKKIILCNSCSEDLATFEIIPEKKRFFIAGCWPSQSEFERFVNLDPLDVQSLFIEELSQEFFYSSVSTQLKGKYLNEEILVKLIFLRESGNEKPLTVIVTNSLETGISTKEIVREYLLRWPNLRQNYEYFKERKQSVSNNAFPIKMDTERLGEIDKLYDSFFEQKGLCEQIEALLLIFNKYCQRNFFPEHCAQLDFPSMRARFYGLPGYIDIGIETMTATLVVSGEDYSDLDALRYAVRRLNENDIFNHISNKKLILQVKSR